MYLGAITLIACKSILTDPYLKKPKKEFKEAGKVAVDRNSIHKEFRGKIQVNLESELR